MAKSKQAKTSSHHPAETGHADAAHAHADADHGHGGGHHGPVETEEQKADRARAQQVEDCWVAALKKPGAVIALVTGSLSLAWLSSLSRSAPPLSWTTLLLLLLAFGWGLALVRGERIEEGESAPSPGGHP